MGPYRPYRFVSKASILIAFLFLTLSISYYERSLNGITSSKRFSGDNKKAALLQGNRTIPHVI